MTEILLLRLRDQNDKALELGGSQAAPVFGCSSHQPRTAHQLNLTDYESLYNHFKMYFLPSVTATFGN